MEWEVRCKVYELEGTLPTQPHSPHLEQVPVLGNGQIGHLEPQRVTRTLAHTQVAALNRGSREGGRLRALGLSYVALAIGFLPLGICALYGCMVSPSPVDPLLQAGLCSPSPALSTLIWIVLPTRRHVSGANPGPPSLHSAGLTHPYYTCPHPQTQENVALVVPPCRPCPGHPFGDTGIGV